MAFSGSSSHKELYIAPLMDVATNILQRDILIYSDRQLLIPSRKRCDG